MEIIINGEKKTFQEGVTLADVIQKLKLDGKVMAAACNMEIIKQDKWSQTPLHDGDKLELLDFVGGG
jgi:sulfur carrier protein